jgi:hypothetical protein
MEKRLAGDGGLELAGCPAGVYFVKIIAEGGVWTEQIVKQ